MKINLLQMKVALKMYIIETGLVCCGISELYGVFNSEEILSTKKFLRENSLNKIPFEDWPGEVKEMAAIFLFEIFWMILSMLFYFPQKIFPMATIFVASYIPKSIKNNTKLIQIDYFFRSLIFFSTAFFVFMSK